MVKEFHGKRYYVELENVYQAVDAQRFLDTIKGLRDETFGLRKMPNNHWIIYSNSPVETFRGQKYSDWEKFKRYVYKLKKAKYVDKYVDGGLSG